MYEDETGLVHFNYYSQTNCIEECKALAVQQKCGCNIFLLPSNFFKRFSIYEFIHTKKCVMYCLYQTSHFLLGGFGDTLCRPTDYDCAEQAESKFAFIYNIFKH